VRGEERHRWRERARETERERARAREKESARERERETVCVCEREREKDRERKGESLLLHAIWIVYSLLLWRHVCVRERGEEVHTHVCVQGMTFVYTQ